MKQMSFVAMASGCEVVIGGLGDEAAHAIAMAAVAEVRRIEARFSRYRPDSIVSRINAAAGGGPVDCDEETVSLLDYADRLHGISDGLFDITSGVLRRAWNFRVPRVPSSAELDAALRLVGWPRVQRDGRSVRLPEAGMELDFGGFGKEYAADRAGGVLARAGVVSGYVNLGGDIRVLGPKPDGQPWMMGIQDPRLPDRLLATIPIERGALATSGDYERFFEIDGSRYCHILDPRSGRPVTWWRSVTVLAPLAVIAGNCSTIAMLRQADGLDFLDSSGMSYLAVDRRGDIHTKQRQPG